MPAHHPPCGREIDAQYQQLSADLQAEEDAALAEKQELEVPPPLVQKELRTKSKRRISPPRCGAFCFSAIATSAGISFAKPVSLLAAILDNQRVLGLIAASNCSNICGWIFPSKKNTFLPCFGTGLAQTHKQTQGCVLAQVSFPLKNICAERRKGMFSKELIPKSVPPPLEMKRERPI